MVLNRKIILCVLFSLMCTFIAIALFAQTKKDDKEFFKQLYWPNTFVENSKLLVDKIKRLENQKQVEMVDNEVPNFPVKYWDKHKGKILQFNKTCAKFPSLFDIRFQNIYWQHFASKNGDYQLFGAYLDTREENKLGPTVRILAMLDKIDPIPPAYCQIWFDEITQPFITRTLEYDLAWRKTFPNYKAGIYQPYLIPCQINATYHNLTVSAVSLVDHECDTANNSLKVIYNKAQTKHEFAVCVKGMDFLLEDVSSVLIEWIELITMLGAHKIFIYNLHVHSNVTKVLDYYKNEGRIDVVPLTLPGGRPNMPYWQHIYLEAMEGNKWQDEIIPYNDCLYKHMYEYKYMVLIDIDEVIVPYNGNTWYDLISMLNKTLKKEFASYNARNVYFYTDLRFVHNWFDNIPSYMHVLQHIYRSPEILAPKMHIKSFHSTKKVLALHNHFPISCLNGYCENHSINPKLALMHHYKRKPNETYSTFKKTAFKDTTIWKYREPLVKRVTEILKKLGFVAE